MSISFACPACRYEIKTSDEYAGRQARCPKCSAVLTVPPAKSAAAAAHDDYDHDDDDEDEHEESLLPHKDQPHEDLIDMTPMVDIVFFLLIFFLTTTMTALQAVMNLPNPQKATEKGAARSVSEITQDNDALTVTIQDDDTFWIDDEQCFSDQDLRVKIKQAIADSSGKPLTLIVVGSADASHGAAIRVFDAGAATGVGSISLLVKEDLDEK